MNSVAEQTHLFFRGYLLSIFTIKSSNQPPFTRFSLTIYIVTFLNSLCVTPLWYLTLNPWKSKTDELSEDKSDRYDDYDHKRE